MTTAAALASRRFGLFPFRSPLLRESRFLSFPRATKMFQFAAYRYPPYVFRREHARITTRRFPHSEIPGSKVGQHLTRAYRSRPRPSSALGAKASTVCPSSLDREEHVVCRYGVFKVHAGAFRPNEKAAPGRGLSKLSSTRYVEFDVVLGELVTGRPKPSTAE